MTQAIDLTQDVQSQPVKQPRFLVGIPYYGGVDNEHARAVRELIQLPETHDLMEIHGCPYIDIARSVLAKKALDEGYDGIFFVDHDIIFDPAQAAPMIEEAVQRGAVVAGAYSMRRPGHQMIGALQCEEGQALNVTFFEGGGLHPAVVVGMGFCAIPRAALEQVQERLALPEVKSSFYDRPIYPWFALRTDADAYCGEDVSFCRRCHESGVPIYIDTRVKLYHKGAYSYSLEDCGIVVPNARQLKMTLGQANAAPQASEHQVEPARAGHYPGEELADKLDMPLGQLLVDQHREHFKSTYREVPTMKHPSDAWIYQEIISETLPDVIVEIGTHAGGSALWLRDLLFAIRPEDALPLVVSVDCTHEHLDPRVKAVSEEFGSGLMLIEGRAEDSAVFDAVKKVASTGRHSPPRVMVIEDSSHGKEQCLQVLQLYSQLVAKGCYLIVEDTNCHHGIVAGPNPGPYEAVFEFLGGKPGFKIDPRRERFTTTHNPCGFLLRTE